MVSESQTLLLDAAISGCMLGFFLNFYFFPRGVEGMFREGVEVVENLREVLLMFFWRDPKR